MNTACYLYFPSFNYGMSVPTKVVWTFIFLYCTGTSVAGVSLFTEVIVSVTIVSCSSCTIHSFCYSMLWKVQALAVLEYRVFILSASGYTGTHGFKLILGSQTVIV